MGFIFGLIKRLIKFALYFVLCVAIITLIPNLPPYTKFTSIEIEPTLPKVGPLEPNGLLNNVEQLYKNKVVGPEAFQLYNGEIYTSLGTGEIVKLSSGGHVTFVTKIGQPCQGLHQEHICGRPLGFVIDEKSGKMYVADAYYGIWKVDIKTDKKQLLVSPRVEINGRTPKLFNSVALAKNGDLYWTDSTSDFPLNKGVKSMLSDPSGRLFHYNSATNQSKVLLDDLWFANGVAISPDNQFVVVAETNRFRLIKYYIDGPKKGQSEVFLAGIPGIPDNLKALPDGSGLQVGLYVSFDEENLLVSKSMAKTPVIRKFLARMISLAEMPIEFLNSQFPSVVLEGIAHNIASFKTFSGLMPKLSGLLQVDWNGNIVASYYNTDGSVKHISDAVVYQDKLLTGSPHGQDFVGAIPNIPPLLKKAYATKPSTPPKAAESVPKHSPKATEAPKPKVQEKPKAEEKKEVPKVGKPVVQEPPKPAQQPKPVEPVKTTTPKPVEKKPTPTAPPTKPSPIQTEAKPQTEQIKSTTPLPKTATPPKPEKVEKPAAAKPVQTPPSKPETKKSETKQKPPQDKAARPAPKEIPIKEDIPSDTAKPSKETLKVIKRDGPAEIPNPNL